MAAKPRTAGGRIGATPAGWQSMLQVELRGLRGHGRAEAAAFARDLHALLPSRTTQAGRERFLRQARRSQQLTSGEYAILALSGDLATIVSAARHWSSAEVQILFSALRERMRSMCAEARFNLHLGDVPRWIENHETDDHRAEAVAACVALDAPIEVQIDRRLAKAGSQKTVFAGAWTVADDPTEIVIKQLTDEMREILQRELRPHPLSMRHPNIIETYALANQARNPEVFLVERQLEPLDDGYRAAGWSDAARLFVDIARALAFLSDQGLVHGDIKPDNIASRDGRYILLDFGICRPGSDFHGPGATATGSLRTRAPEVLLGEPHSEKSDVWALGATVFNALVGRFPLWRSKDPMLPRIQDDRGERADAEERMRRRIRTGYRKSFLPLEQVGHKDLRELLYAALERDPGKRVRADELLACGLRTLPSLIGLQDGPRFNPSVELEAFERHLSREDSDLRLMSPRERRDMRVRLEGIRRAMVARRYYRRPAADLAGLLRAAAEELPGDEPDLFVAQQVATSAEGYLDRTDRVDDKRVAALEGRLLPIAVESREGETFVARDDLEHDLGLLVASRLCKDPQVADAREALIRLLPSRQ